MPERRPISEILGDSDTRVYPAGFDPRPDRGKSSRAKSGLLPPSYKHCTTTIAPMDYIRPTMFPENAVHFALLKRISNVAQFGSLLQKVTSARQVVKQPIHWDLRAGNRDSTGIPNYSRMLPPFAYTVALQCEHCESKHTPCIVMDTGPPDFKGWARLTNCLACVLAKNNCSRKNDDGALCNLDLLFDEATTSPLLKADPRHYRLVPKAGPVGREEKAMSKTPTPSGSGAGAGAKSSKIKYGEFVDPDEEDEEDSVSTAEAEHDLDDDGDGDGNGNSSCRRAAKGKRPRSPSDEPDDSESIFKRLKSDLDVVNPETLHELIEIRKAVSAWLDGHMRRLADESENTRIAQAEEIERSNKIVAERDERIAMLEGQLEKAQANTVMPTFTNKVEELRYLVRTGRTSDAKKLLDDPQFRPDLDQWMT